MSTIPISVIGLPVTPLALEPREPPCELVSFCIRIHIFRHAWFSCAGIPEDQTPLRVMDFATAVPPVTMHVVRELEVPRNHRRALNDTSRPIRTLPAIATQPAMAVSGPMTTLCAIWTWLSILTRSPTTVS